MSSIGSSQLALYRFAFVPIDWGVICKSTSWNVKFSLIAEDESHFVGEKISAINHTDARTGITTRLPAA